MHLGKINQPKSGHSQPQTMAKRKRNDGGEVSKNGRQKNGEGKHGKKLIINAFVEMCKFMLLRVLSCQL
jgi:hypothetical protein